MLLKQVKTSRPKYLWLAGGFQWFITRVRGWDGVTLWPLLTCLLVASGLIFELLFICKVVELFRPTAEKWFAYLQREKQKSGGYGRAVEQHDHKLSRGAEKLLCSFWRRRKKQRTALLWWHSELLAHNVNISFCARYIHILVRWWNRMVQCTCTASHVPGVSKLHWTPTYCLKCHCVRGCFPSFPTTF